MEGTRASPAFTGPQFTHRAVQPSGSTCTASLRPHRVQKVVVASSMSIYGEGAYECARCGVLYPGERAEAQMATRSWEHACASCGGALSPRPTPEAKPLACTSIYAITKT